MDTSAPPVPDAAALERARLGALRAYAVLDTPHEEAFDRLVQAAAEIAGTPAATMTLVDADRQWFKASCGTDSTGSARDIAFCDHVVRDDEALEVQDARLDPRFADNPFVTGEPGIRFYAGFPLRTPRGAVLGTLCVWGPEPKVLTAGQRRLLGVLTDQVMGQLELRRRVAAQDAMQVQIVQSEARYRSLVEQTPDAILVTVAGQIVFANPSAAQLLGAPAPVALYGTAVADLTGPRTSPLASAGRTRRTRVRRLDGTWVTVDVTAARTDFDGQAAVQSIIRDVTDLEHLASELAAERDEAERRTAFVEAVLDTIDVGVVACGEDGRLTMVNRAARAFHGLTGSDELPEPDWDGRHDLREEDGVTPLEPGRLPLQRALHDGVVSGQHMTVAPAGLPPRTVQCDGRALRDHRGRPLGAVVALKDVTAVRASEQRFRAAFVNGPTPVAHLSPAGVLLDVNPALRRFLARRSGSLVGRSLAELVHPEDSHLVESALRDGGTGTAPLEVRFLRLDGTAVWCELATTVDTGSDGATYVLAQLLDVHARKQHEQALQRAALHDRLTGAANRQVLDEQLAELLDPMTGPGAMVLFADLDGFKAINDTHGHDAGDAVLVEVARRLMAVVRPQDWIVRLGGDEFVVLCPMPTGSADAAVAALTGRIQTALAAPVDHGAQRLHVGVSIGSAVASAGTSPAAVLELADRSMYADKQTRSALVAR